MTYKTFSVDIDADGIALLTIDLPDASSIARNTKYTLNNTIITHSEY